MAEQGPFQTEREASQTKAVRAVYAAFDADPGAGKMAPHNTAIITAACEKAEVVLGAFDARQVEWLGTWEPHTCVVVAGMIRRAREAGEAAAAARTVAEWGVRFTMSPGDRVESEVANEEAARTAVANMRDRHPEFDAVLVRRAAAMPPGDWEEVPDA